MNMLNLKKVVEQDADCVKLLNKRIIDNSLHGIIIYATLEAASGADKVETYDYWVNTCLGRSLNIDDHTEEDIKEYLKLKWLQIVLISELLKHLHNFVIDFSKLKPYTTYSLKNSLPAKEAFHVTDISLQFNTLTTSNFAVYRVEGTTNFDKDTTIVLEFNIPFQMIAVIDRPKFTSFKDFFDDQRNSGFYLAYSANKHGEWTGTSKIYLNFSKNMKETINLALAKSVAASLIID